MESVTLHPEASVDETRAWSGFAQIQSESQVESIRERLKMLLQLPNSSYIQRLPGYTAYQILSDELPESFFVEDIFWCSTHAIPQNFKTPTPILFTYGSGMGTGDPTFWRSPWKFPLQIVFWWLKAIKLASDQLSFETKGGQSCYWKEAKGL